MSNPSADTLRLQIIKRIAPGYRHRVLGNMQPIALLSQLVTKKIQVNQKESEYLLTCMKEIKDSLKVASRTIDDLFTWLNPQENLLPVNEIVKDCLDLLKMEIHSSKVSFVNQVASSELVKASAFRGMVSACLLTYIDTVEQDAEIVISLKPDAGNVTIVMTIRHTESKVQAPSKARGPFSSWDNLHLLSEHVHFAVANDTLTIASVA